MTIAYSKVRVGLTRADVTQKIYMVQGDSGRGLKVTLTDDIFTDGEKEIYSSKYNARLVAVKPSGLIVVINASSDVEKYVGTNAYEVTFESSTEFQNVIAENGSVKCELQLTDSNDVVTSFAFYIEVTKPASSIEAILSTSDFKTLAESLTKIKEYEDILKNYVENVGEKAKLTKNVSYGITAPNDSYGDVGDIYIQLIGG